MIQRTVDKVTIRLHLLQADSVAELEDDPELWAGYWGENEPPPSCAFHQMPVADLFVVLRRGNELDPCA